MLLVILLDSPASSGEIDLSLEGPDGETLGAPATTHVYNQVQNLMVERGYRPDVGTHMPNLLRDAVGPDGEAYFTDIDSRTIPFPMGRHNPVMEQREISTLAMEALERQASALRPFLLSTGQVDVEVNGLLDAHRRELLEMSARMNYRITWAKRR